MGEAQGAARPIRRHGPLGHTVRGDEQGWDAHPYFLIARKDLPLNGDNPTLLYGYGGFEVALRPAYAPLVGKGWLEKGGVYAVANIRGGGEFGPAWHRAALKENRQRAYDDFIAVAEDLIARKITSPKRLGIRGDPMAGFSPA